jgi:chromosome partitioning protein
MSARIVTVTNQKGGAGKTTLVMQIGGTLGLRGNKVLIVDADPQGTATRWAAAASDGSPFPAAMAGLSAAGEKVHREVKKYVDSYSSSSIVRRPLSQLRREAPFS